LKNKKIVCSKLQALNSTTDDDGKLALTYLYRMSTTVNFQN